MKNYVKHLNIKYPLQAVQFPNRLLKYMIKTVIFKNIFIHKAKKIHRKAVKNTWNNNFLHLIFKIHKINKKYTLL